MILLGFDFSRAVFQIRNGTGEAQVFGMRVYGLGRELVLNVLFQIVLGLAIQPQLFVHLFEETHEERVCSILDLDLFDQLFLHIVVDQIDVVAFFSIQKLIILVFISNKETKQNKKKGKLRRER